MGSIGNFKAESNESLALSFRPFTGLCWHNINVDINIQEQYFVNGIQWQLSFNTQNIYILRTILFRGWPNFFMGCGGGGGWGQYIIV